MSFDDERDHVEERANAADFHREELSELRGEQLNDMVRGYVECALWAGQDWSRVNDEDPDADDNPVPWDDNYGPEDLSEDAWKVIRDTCRDFCGYVGERFGPDALDTWVGFGQSWESVGHDFYLTRNGHGAGFWDRFLDGGEREILGRHLADAARIWGESDFYIDGAKLHVEG